MPLRTHTRAHCCNAQSMFVALVFQWLPFPSAFSSTLAMERGAECAMVSGTWCPADGLPSAEAWHKMTVFKSQMASQGALQLRLCHFSDPYSPMAGLRYILKAELTHAQAHIYNYLISFGGKDRLADEVIVNMK